MHELSICRSIAKIVEQHAQGRPVERVRLSVGHLRQVVPTTLEFCWDIAVEGSQLEGARLDIDHVPARLSCAACDTVTEITVPVLRCSSCGSIDTTLLSGEELLVTSFDLVGADSGA